MTEIFTKRGRLEIIYEILSICNAPAQKTRVLYRCNLSYEQLQKYLGYLISRRLLRTFKNRGKDFYQITDNGKAFLEEYERLKHLLDVYKKNVKNNKGHK